MLTLRWTICHWSFNKICYIVTRKQQSVLKESIVTGNVDEQSPTTITRKRKRDKQQWACNKRKYLHYTGQSYVTPKGKIIATKILAPNRISCYKKNCSDIISENEYQELFTKFRKLGSHSAPIKLYCWLHCTKRNYHPKSWNFSVWNVWWRKKDGRTSGFNQRTYSRKFIARVSDRSVRGCKKVFCFFLKLFQISNGRVDRILKNQLANWGIPQADRRGKHRR